LYFEEWVQVKCLSHFLFAFFKKILYNIYSKNKRGKNMTVGYIIFGIVLSLLVGGFGSYLAYSFFEEKNTNACVITMISVIVLMAAYWALGGMYFKYTESGKRAIKTQDSNFNGGIVREVKVYDVEGDLIQSYKGKFDVDYDNDRIIFDDENGCRHIIYYPTGTIIIDEVEEV
jgi:uncharacterized membrane protein YwzB